MLQSKLFNPTKRSAPKDEVSKNAILLIKAGYIDKLMSGVYSFLPLGWRVERKIEDIIRKEMDAVGGQEIFLPAMGPKENWEKTGRWYTLDVLYKFKDKPEFALNPTHEEIITPLVKSYLATYKNFPLYLYQFQTKFRKEPRAKSGLLRGREFLMKDLYSFHTNEKDLDEYYEKVKGAYWKILEKLELKEKTYLTLASGGSFSKFSDEFQTESEAGEDTIYVCQKCSTALNEEIIKEQKVCPKCETSDFKKTKAIEVANIFKLNSKYSKPFELKFKDKDGSEKDVIMGCYGMGPSRIMGTVVELLSDEKGLVWPEAIAPFKVHLIEVGSKNPEVRKTGKNLYDKLVAAGIETLFDDREISAGEKFVESDLIGIPWRIIVSEKSLSKGEFELENRKEKGKPQYLPPEALIKKLK